MYKNLNGTRSCDNLYSSFIFVKVDYIPTASTIKRYGTVKKSFYVFLKVFADFKTDSKKGTVVYTYRKTKCRLTKT